MRVYSLANPDYRKSVDLTEFENYIQKAVKDTNPNLQVVVDKNSYAIPDTVTTGEIIKIGRAIAKSPLRKYCMERPVLFVGVESAYDDVFADVEIDEDER